MQRSGTVKTVPYRMFWGALLTCKISVGRVSEARLTGNARQFAKQTRSCSCKTHWVLHCSPSHFRKGNTAQFPPDGLSTAPAAAALRIMRYCLKAFFFVFWFPIFAAFRNGQDRSLQNVLGCIANLQNIRRARFGGPLDGQCPSVCKANPLVQLQNPLGFALLAITFS